MYYINKMVYLCNLRPTTLSSFFFATNVLQLYNKNDKLYFYSFAGLLTASVLNHQTRKKVFYYIDKACIVSVVYFGGKNFIQYAPVNSLSILVPFKFCTIFWLYYYGYSQNKYCFDKDEKKGNYYHIFLHMLSSFGHNIIAYYMP